MKKFYVSFLGVWCALLFVTGCNFGSEGSENSSKGKFSFAEKLDANPGLDREICDSLRATRKFDTGTRRSILKDYGAPLAVISGVEKNLDTLLTMDACLFTLGFQAAMAEM